MFLTKGQAEKRLSSEKNLARASFLVKDENPVTITEKVIPVKGKTGVNLTKEVRTEIAIRTRAGESQSSVARDLGISQPAVSNIQNGKVKGIDESKTEKVLGEVKDIALSRLMASLGLLTDDKLSGCSAKDLSVIASNMGRVVEKIQPPSEKNDNINFIIYAPEIKQERAYQVVEI